jgi:hypothetical protein
VNLSANVDSRGRWIDPTAGEYAAAIRGQS